MLDRRRFALAATAAFAAPTLASAQGSFPPNVRSVKLVIPFPAGGATDVVGRLFAEQLNRMWGTPFVIENKTGAGGNIAADQVVKATPDGSELLLASVSIATNHHVMPNMTFNPLTDLAPIGVVTTFPNVIVVRNGLNVSTVPELVALARSRPGQLTFGSTGTASISHLATTLLMMRAGIQMTHVPYRGTGPAMTDLLANRLDVLFDATSTALPHLRAGNARGIAVTSPTRTATLPDIPPLADLYPGYQALTWNGLFAPARTPREITQRMSRDLHQALRAPEVTARFTELSIDAVGSTPEELAAWHKRESDQWGQVIRETNIRLEG